MIPRGSRRSATFGARLREARLGVRDASGRRWTQDHLARAVAVERNTVSRWENGGVLPRDPAVVARVAGALGVSTDWLLGADGGSGAEHGAAAERGRAGDPGAGSHSAVSAGAAAYERLLQAYSGKKRGSGSLPPAALSVMAGYLGRLVAAGCAPQQLKEAERLMVEAARNRMASVPLAERSAEDVVADIDAAWDFVASVLRREGRRP